tara:strand:- start:1612 stop:2748 length:1137 start_codon:yes stop_codon:yes gene_type:complete
MKILFITAFYPPNNTGSSTIMGNLIKEIDKEIVYGVITQANSYFDKKEILNDMPVHKIFHFQYLFSPRLWFILRKLLVIFEKFKIKKIIKKENITHVVGVYPDLEFLEIARISANQAKVKFLPYLHDTIIEGLSHKRFRRYSAKVQEKILKNSNKIFVMSEGMKDLYKSKYNIETIPLFHSFSEKVGFSYNSENLENSLFWGGSVYSINKECVKRIHNVCCDINLSIKFSAVNRLQKLLNLGFSNKNIDIMPFLKRSDYINTISLQKGLLLAIDWPDESSVHEDELSTIFPTKTIEYLISGRPIFIHCPSDYFLAKFFKKNKCGIIIDSRKPDNIKQIILRNLSDESKLIEIVKNAFETSKMFHVSNIKRTFEKHINC